MITLDKLYGMQVQYRRGDYRKEVETDVGMQ